MTEISREGLSLQEANKVAILIHGRGANANSILSLKDYLHLEGFALLAPNAQNNTWYPYSFMAPDAQNEPAFSQAIQQIQSLVKECLDQGFKTEDIYFIGFSQGACLALEYATQNAAKYGGVIAFTGGLIGEKILKEKYKGDFAGTNVFIGSSKQDMHVPLSRIQESAKLMKEMGAQVKTLIFEDPQHTIREEEIEWVNKYILSGEV
ncbi:dienelactone hydrolase family protein [Litoribacter ruber]|uniref:alpha/beta hydrolase n=1 Tax=Litoribacter ruber TaxID=702568 RepID=UPI001BDA3934|nr:dienelactone hydrolase family protein [Litoribacter ruber]MBT0809889.1 dienelactone hydrolase family protein [Litoribacter ruber]